MRRQSAWRGWRGDLGWLGIGFGRHGLLRRRTFARCRALGRNGLWRRRWDSCSRNCCGGCRFCSNGSLEEFLCECLLCVELAIFRRVLSSLGIGWSAHRVKCSRRSGPGHEEWIRAQPGSQKILPAVISTVVASCSTFYEQRQVGIPMFLAGKTANLR